MDRAINAVRFSVPCFVAPIAMPTVKLYPDKLDAHLASDPAGIYLLHGDEPLQIMELGDRLRAHARDRGYAERQVLLASDDADWGAFREAADSLSLFAERRLIEVRMPTGKPGRQGSEVLKQYCQAPPEDVFLLISSARLDRGGTNSAWFKALDKVGVSIAVWPIAPNALGKWLTERFASVGLKPTREALQLVGERVEGNMLAAAQEVERLALLYPRGELDAAQVLDAVADSSRYSIGDLPVAALQGLESRAIKITRGLRDEAVAPVLVLWALTQEIRSGSRVAEARSAGQRLDAALKSAGVWQNRAAALKVALARHEPQSWLAMLASCSHIDRMIKGQAAGDPWQAFEQLVVQLAGRGQVLLEAVPDSFGSSA